MPGLSSSTATPRRSPRPGGYRVVFRLGDGRTLELGRDDPQLRHLDHAWASTVHAFQGRTVDNVIAVMEAKHLHLKTQKNFYVEISRAQHGADLVNEVAKALRETLEAATNERVSALEGTGAAKEKTLIREKGRGVEAGPEWIGRTLETGARVRSEKARELEKSREPRGMWLEM